MSMGEHVECANRSEMVSVTMNQLAGIACQRSGMAGNINDSPRLHCWHCCDRGFGACARRIEQDDVPMLAKKRPVGLGQIRGNEPGVADVVSAGIGDGTRNQSGRTVNATDLGHTSCDWQAEIAKPAIQIENPVGRNESGRVDCGSDQCLIDFRVNLDEISGLELDSNAVRLERIGELARWLTDRGYRVRPARLDVNINIESLSESRKEIDVSGAGRIEYSQDDGA